MKDWNKPALDKYATVHTETYELVEKVYKGPDLAPLSRQFAATNDMRELVLKDLREGFITRQEAERHLRRLEKDCQIILNEICHLENMFTHYKVRVKSKEVAFL